MRHGPTLPRADGVGDPTDAMIAEMRALDVSSPNAGCAKI
jgi:hypothetical protein